MPAAAKEITTPAPVPEKEKTPTPVKKKRTKKTGAAPLPAGTPGTVSIRMYCLGTGDCFVVKFFRKNDPPFVMMIDCGSCQGSKEDFQFYIDTPDAADKTPDKRYQKESLTNYIGDTIDLLVVTHEHTDHVTGFDKCDISFQKFNIKKAWFAWTEEPGDPSGDAAALLKKKTDMKAALGKAAAEISKRSLALEDSLAHHPMKAELVAAQQAFNDGVQSLSGINLAPQNDDGEDVFSITGAPLPGMKKIKDLLLEKKVLIEYPGPGNTLELQELPGIRFHILGPPHSRDFIFKDGKQGQDVYKNNTKLDESALAAKAFNGLGGTGLQPDDLPFTDNYLMADEKPGPGENKIRSNYENAEEAWRKIDDEWLMSAGLLALRLNSHINNTSLAMAIESVGSEKVLLLPGDAEYGSWESWHLIENWKGKGKNGKHLVEDLLNRTAFYKVGHHLSYNGTALEKGINMMPADNMIAMATLDLDRISKGWKSTMPNRELQKELTRRTGGRFFIMNENGITNAPSATLDPSLLSEAEYKALPMPDGKSYFYKQFTLAF